MVLGLGAASLGSDDRYRDDHAFLAASIGATGGAVAGMLTAGSVSPTTARVRFLDLGGLAGTLLGGGLYLAAVGEDTDAESLAMVTALGTSAGLAAAWAFTAGMPRDEGATVPRAALEVHPFITPTHGGGSLGLIGAW
jgi:hypothetical protein